MLNSLTPILQNETLFGDRVITDIITDPGITQMLDLRIIKNPRVTLDFLKI